MKATFIIALINLAIINQSTSAGIEDYYQERSCANANITEKNATAFSLDYCKTLVPGTGIYRCCYAHAKVSQGTVRGCLPLTYDQFNNIDDVKLSFENEDLSIDCYSKYLTITASLMALLFVLF